MPERPKLHNVVSGKCFKGGQEYWISGKTIMMVRFIRIIMGDLFSVPCLVHIGLLLSLCDTVPCQLNGNSTVSDVKIVASQIP